MGLGVVAVLLLILLDRTVSVSSRFIHSTAGGRSRDRTAYHGKSFIVTEIIDGDTLELDAPDGARNTTRVRLLGIDAPEAGHPQTAPMYYARQATGHLAQLAAGAKVTVYLNEKGPSRGRYDRLLAYLELPDGRFLNELLIAEGCVYADRRFGHGYYRKYRQLEGIARAGRVGLWRSVSREQFPAWLQRMEPDLLKP